MFSSLAKVGKGSSLIGGSHTNSAEHKKALRQVQSGLAEDTGDAKVSTMMILLLKMGKVNPNLARMFALRIQQNYSFIPLQEKKHCLFQDGNCRTSSGRARVIAQLLSGTAQRLFTMPWKRAAAGAFWQLCTAATSGTAQKWGQLYTTSTLNCSQKNPLLHPPLQQCYRTSSVTTLLTAPKCHSPTGIHALQGFAGKTQLPW